MHRLLPEVVARIGRAYGAGARCLLIVPEQYTLQAETEIVEGLRLPGYFDIDVLSPSRLRDRVFERAGQPQRVRIDERGKCMVLSAALQILSEEERTCVVRVPNNQLSLAIGNKGQNAKLAAKLTGYKIDIKPEYDVLHPEVSKPEASVHPAAESESAAAEEIETAASQPVSMAAAATAEENEVEE